MLKTSLAAAGALCALLVSAPLAVAAPNLTRIVVQGSTNTPHEWLRLRVDPATTGVFSWENVVFGG